MYWHFGIVHQRPPWGCGCRPVIGPFNEWDAEDEENGRKREEEEEEEAKIKNNQQTLHRSTAHYDRLPFEIGGGVPAKRKERGSEAKK